MAELLAEILVKNFAKILAEVSAESIPEYLAEFLAWLNISMFKVARPVRISDIEDSTKINAMSK